MAYSDKQLTALEHMTAIVREAMYQVRFNPVGGSKYHKAAA